MPDHWENETANPRANFKPSMSGIDDTGYKFYIYDRWGKVLFFTGDVNKGWDGKSNEKKCQPGVYVYYILYQSKTGKEFKLKGTVTLIR